MRLLFDTHVVLWHLAGTRDLSAAAGHAISNSDDLRISVVSFAEVGIKAAIGKLDIPDALAERVEAAGLRQLGLSVEHGLAVAEIPTHHRDPFDRLLIAQARCDGLSIVTADRRFGEYDVPVVWA